MTDTAWTREVCARLRAQYPRIPAAEVEALLALWWRVLDPDQADQGALRAEVEEQVRAALKSLSATLQRSRPARHLVLPRQRGTANPVRTAARSTS